MFLNSISNVGSLSGRLLCYDYCDLSKQSPIDTIDSGFIPKKPAKVYHIRNMLIGVPEFPFTKGTQWPG